jgi:hypothetical protein
MGVSPRYHLPSRMRRQLRGLPAGRHGLGNGVITPQEAEAQVVTPSQYTGAKMTQAEVDAIIQSATQGYLPFGPADWQPGWNCNGRPSVGAAQILQIGGGLGLGFAGAEGSAIAATIGVSASIIGLAFAGIGAIIGLFIAIFEHHAQAVAKEENVLCQAVPALNNTLNALSTAVQNGTISYATGIATLPQIQQEFASAVASIIKDDQSHCNAACVWTMCLAAIVLVWTSEWQAAIAAETPAPAAASTAPANASGNTAVTVTPTGAAVASTPAAAVSTTPDWLLPVAAVGLIAILFLK